MYEPRDADLYKKVTQYALGKFEATENAKGMDEHRVFWPWIGVVNEDIQGRNAR